MAETTRANKSLLDDFNEQQDAPPTYEQLPNYGQAQGYPQGVQTSQNTVVITQPYGMAPGIKEQRPDATGYIALSCFVFWCCCWPLGLFAFILAIVASSDVNATSAKGHLKVSSILSIVGIVSGFVLIAISAVYYTVAITNAENNE